MATTCETAIRLPGLLAYSARNCLRTPPHPAARYPPPSATASPPGQSLHLCWRSVATKGLAYRRQVGQRPAGWAVEACYAPDAPSSLEVQNRTMPTELQTAIDHLSRAQRVVVFTGAGVSAESGIPTFRDDMTGLWARFDPQRLATPDAFLADPELVWGWYEWRRARLGQVQPNPGHTAIAQLEQHRPRVCVDTRNVDDLHERAGSTRVLHLHGSIQSRRCHDCARPMQIPLAGLEQLGDGQRMAPPRCEDCDG